MFDLKALSTYLNLVLRPEEVSLLIFLCVITCMHVSIATHGRFLLTCHILFKQGVVHQGDV